MRKTKKSLLVLVCALCAIVAASLAFDIIDGHRQNTSMAVVGNIAVTTQSQNSNVDVYYLDGSLWIYNLAEVFPFICIPTASGMYDLEAFRRGGGYNAYNIYDSTGLVYSFDDNEIITESIYLKAYEEYYIELAEYAIDMGAYIFRLDLDYVIVDYVDGVWIYNLADSFPFTFMMTNSGYYIIEAFRRGGDGIAIEIYDLSGAIYDSGFVDEIYDTIYLNAYTEYHVSLNEIAIDNGAYIFRLY